MDKTAQIPELSMFASTPVYETGGELRFGLMRRCVSPHPSDRAYTVDQGTANKLPVISTQMYGTPLLWWAIAQVNGIIDPLSDVPYGTNLRIPSRARIQL